MYFLSFKGFLSGWANRSICFTYLFDFCDLWLSLYQHLVPHLAHNRYQWTHAAWLTSLNNAQHKNVKSFSFVKVISYPNWLLIHHNLLSIKDGIWWTRESPSESPCSLQGFLDYIFMRMQGKCSVIKVESFVLFLPLLSLCRPCLKRKVRDHLQAFPDLSLWKM